MTTPPSAEKKARALWILNDLDKPMIWLNEPKHVKNVVKFINAEDFEELERDYAQLKKSSEFFDNQYYKLKAQLKRTELALEKAKASFDSISKTNGSSALYMQQEAERASDEITSILTGESNV